MFAYGDHQFYGAIKYLHLFRDPYCRFYKMTVAYTVGGAELFSTTAGLLGYVWKAYVDDKDRIVVQREGEHDFHVVTTKANVTQLDITFDQNMRPFLTYVANGLPYYYHFNSDLSTYSEVALDPHIKFPRCELDMREAGSIPRSDIVLAYTRGGKLCYRIQRERFRQEHVIATDKKKTMVWRIGSLTNGRFGFLWR